MSDATPLVKELMAELKCEIIKEVSLLRRNVDHELLKVLKKFSDQTKVLKEIKEVHENVEETLLNVLVAIRQNEYLQAYYPAQQGHPEMKVVGKHPAGK